jgi:hypothetical protein
MKTILARSMTYGDTADAIDTLVSDVRRQLEGRAPVIGLVFASSPAQSLEAAMAAVKARMPDTLLIGASTAAEFTEQETSKGAVVLAAIAGDFKAFAAMGRGLGAALEETATKVAEALPHAVEGYPYATGILLLDTLTGNGEEATLLTAALFEGKLRLAGGAAGADLGADPKTTLVACGREVASDAMVLALLYSRSPLGVAVQHGHQPITDTVKVTRSEGSRVYEIDGRPAWDVWLEKTRERALLRGIDPDMLSSRPDFTSYLILYQAGLDTGSGLKIRTPFFRNPDKSLDFACGVLQGTELKITESFPEPQIASARRAAREARAALSGRRVAGALVFDCACRGLILEEDFPKAVTAMSEELGDAPIAGFETYGEIALDVGDMSGFHNTTSVVLVFPEE